MITAVEFYLAVRRAAGFTLSNTEYLLRSFSAFAADRKQTHIRTATTIDWASQAGSVAQRHTRYQTIYHFAQYLRVEDPRHESPPPNHFGYRKTRRVPHIYSRGEIHGLVLAATRLSSSDPLQPRTYAALISLLAATGLRISEALHLLVTDITPNGLLIRRTKFQKTRLCYRDCQSYGFHWHSHHGSGSRESFLARQKVYRLSPTSLLEKIRVFFGCFC